MNGSRYSPAFAFICGLDRLNHMEQNKTIVTKKSHNIKWWYIGVLVVFLLIIGNLNNQTINREKNVQPFDTIVNTLTNIQPKIKNSSNSVISNNKEDNQSFKKISIKDLVILDQNVSGASNTIPLVEYEGKVTQEKKYSGPYYLFKVEDGNGYAVIAHIDPKTLPGLNEKIHIGDTVIVRGLNTSGTKCPDNSGTIPNLCIDFNLTQNNLPITLLMPPDPKLDNRQAIEIINSF